MAARSSHTQRWTHWTASVCSCAQFAPAGFLRTQGGLISDNYVLAFGDLLGRGDSEIGNSCTDSHSRSGEWNHYCGDINFNIDANILLNPFNFDAKLKVNNKKVENIIDNLILNLLSYDENYLGNINGDLIIEFNNLNNKLIKNGIIQLNISEKKIFLRKVNFEVDKIGEINSNISFVTDQGQTKFFSKNHLIVNNHIEFAKAFQIGSKNTKKIKNMYFNLEKSIGETDFIISDIRVNNPEKKNNKSDKFYLVKNIQNLRSLIRNFID